MISSKTLLQLARKWKMVAAIGRKRITFSRTRSKKEAGYTEESPVARKGHFTVNSTNGTRFEVPLSYLSKGVIRELLAIAEDHFGIPVEGPIVLPLDAASMEYLMSMIRRGLALEQEKALLLSFARCSNYISADMAPACRQISVCS
ncbi:hypothetical protein MLD38_023110 [Melastoma candidum]|uniref:Uncharacterized protein n=1 Tax=Melastoma candidum TaxID=119954 RepID=A0ACB9QLM4_9MYRT|nr:hypothetical protein MLD38_023110 [Melastoma candidum]